MNARLLPFLGLALLGACSLPLQTAHTSAPEPSAQAVAACDTRADEEFSRQNRGAVYQADRYDSSIRDSPFSSQGLPGTTTTGLSNQYERGEDVRTCLNGTATPIEPTNTKTPAP